MNEQLAKDLGFLGTNVDSGVELSWLQTEVANKIKGGDQTAILRVHRLYSHSTDPKVRDYAKKIIDMYSDLVADYAHPNR